MSARPRRARRQPLRDPCRRHAPSSAALRRRRRRAPPRPLITSDGADPLGDRVSKLATRSLSRPRRRRARPQRGRALLEPIGELEQRVAVEPVDRLDDQVDAVLGLHLGVRLDLRRRPGGRLSLQLLAQLSISARTASSSRDASVQERLRLAGGDRLDPAGARPDRALGEDGKGADLGGRADMRAAAELAARHPRSRRRGRCRRTSRRTASSRRACGPRRWASRRRARDGFRRSRG